MGYGKPNNPPVAHLRYGNIEATIWENVRSGQNYYAITVVRKYQDSRNQWRESAVFDEKDLPMLSKVVADAHTKIQALKE